MTLPPISLRVSLTDACPLRCIYCRSADEVHPTHHRSRLEGGEMIEAIALLNRVAPIEKIRFTGGEPLLRPDLTALIAACARLSVPDLSLTTSGQLLAGQAAPLRQAGLGRINISLDSLDPETYGRITGGARLADTLSGISAAQDNGFAPIKLNAVIMRGVNDQEAPRMLEFAMAQGCQMRFLELMPIGVAAARFEERFVPWRETYERLAGPFTLAPLPYAPGATSRDYRVRNGQAGAGTCGFISPSSHPFCSGCRRLRLGADGQMLACLARLDRYDLRPALDQARQGDMEPLADLVATALRRKRRRRDLARQRDMARIGG